MPKSNHLAIRQKFDFNWYLALIVVGTTVLSGMTVLYISKAASPTIYGPATMTGGQPIYGSGAQSNIMVARSLATTPVSFSQDLPTNTTQTLCVQLTGVPDGGIKLYASIGVSNAKGGIGGSSDHYVSRDGWLQLYQNDWLLHFAQGGPTATISTVLAGSNGSNQPVPNPTVEVRQFAIEPGGAACPAS